MTKTWHRRTAVASMFQNGISRNTKCAERDGFRRAGHIITIYHTALALLASTYFILTRYNSSCRYRLITSSHGLLRLINLSLDHMIPRMLFMTILHVSHTCMYGTIDNTHLEWISNALNNHSIILVMVT